MKYFEKIREKGFEVLKFKVGSTHYYKQNNGDPYFNVNGRHYFERIHERRIPSDAEITKIKRLSDGTTFSVGDRICPEFTIQSFGHNGTDTIYAKTTAYSILLEDVTFENQPLFQTSDGVDIYSKVEICYVVDDDWSISGVTANELYRSQKVFYSLGEAEKYVHENEPKYSKKDIEAAIYEISRYNNINLIIARLRFELNL